MQVGVAQLQEGLAKPVHQIATNATWLALENVTPPNVSKALSKSKEQPTALSASEPAPPAPVPTPTSALPVPQGSSSAQELAIFVEQHVRPAQPQAPVLPATVALNFLVLAAMLFQQGASVCLQLLPAQPALQDTLSLLAIQAAWWTPLATAQAPALFAITGSICL